MTIEEQAKQLLLNHKCETCSFYLGNMCIKQNNRSHRPNDTCLDWTGEGELIIERKAANSPVIWSDDDQLYPSLHTTTTYKLNAIELTLEQALLWKKYNS